MTNLIRTKDVSLFDHIHALAHTENPPHDANISKAAQEFADMFTMGSTTYNHAFWYGSQKDDYRYDRFTETYAGMVDYVCNEIQYDYMVYRSEYYECFNDALVSPIISAVFSNEDTVEINSFMSTSYRPQCTLGFGGLKYRDTYQTEKIKVFYKIRNHSGHYINAYSSEYRDIEYETILKPYTEYRIVSSVWNEKERILIVELHEVGVNTDKALEKLAELIDLYNQPEQRAQTLDEYRDELKKDSTINTIYNSVSWLKVYYADDSMIVAAYPSNKVATVFTQEDGYIQKTTTYPYPLHDHEQDIRIKTDYTLKTYIEAFII